VEDRISGLEDKTDMKEENRRSLRQKTSKLQKDMQELSDFIKRPTRESWV
jgi:predicted nuclease with TOPRIM domain